MTEDFWPFVEESLQIRSVTGTIDWKASFKNAVECYNSQQIYYGSQIVLRRQEQNRLKNLIASQSLELMDLKEALKTKRTLDTLDADDKPGTSQNGSGEPDSKKAISNSRASSSRQPHYPLIFNKIPDGNAKEPVVRIS